ncbi:MAG: GNAT family N-acetyltransferase [Defluviitaleaceae bacterium]|nr:GNAT family N-acetyltransferase [Defluviitaleaceae bacterium]
MSAMSVMSTKKSAENATVSNKNQTIENQTIDTTSIKIPTKRLLLRAFVQSDLQDFYEYASVPNVGEMAGWPHHKSIAESQEILDMFLQEKNNFALYHTQDKKVVGSLGLHGSWANKKEQYKGLKIAEIGYVLAKNYWGQGLTAEATQAVIAYCFANLDFYALTCCHFLENHQSQRVVEKCGFVFAQQSKYHAKLLDKYFDERQYILLNNLKS